MSFLPDPAGPIDPAGSPPPPTRVGTKVLTAPDPLALADQVQRHEREGWTVAGPPRPMNGPEGGWTQILVRLGVPGRDFAPN